MTESSSNIQAVTFKLVFHYIFFITLLLSVSSVMVLATPQSHSFFFTKLFYNSLYTVCMSSSKYVPVRFFTSLIYCIFVAPLHFFCIVPMVYLVTLNFTFWQTWSFQQHCIALESVKPHVSRLTLYFLYGAR